MDNKRMIYHENSIGHEINESLEYYRDKEEDREIYCRRKHKICIPLQKDCSTCKAFAGWMQGHGIECAWYDVNSLSEYCEQHVPHENRYKEYYRVDQLIKKNKLLDVVTTDMLKNADNIAIVDINEVQQVIKNGTTEKRIYLGNTTERYLLGEKVGENPLICFGINPSTASDIDDDPTICKIRKISEENGCDGWIMLNIYPQRATNPKELHKEDEFVYQLADQNNEVISKVLEMFPEALILAAWGDIIDTRVYLKDCYKKIALPSSNRKWCCRGELTKKNNPRHQLYVSEKTPLSRLFIHENGELVTE